MNSLQHFSKCDIFTPKNISDIMASKISTQLDQFYINNKIYIGPYTLGPDGSLYTG